MSAVSGPGRGTTTAARLRQVSQQCTNRNWIAFDQHLGRMDALGSCREMVAAWGNTLACWPSSNCKAQERAAHADGRHLPSSDIRPTAMFTTRITLEPHTVPGCAGIYLYEITGKTRNVVSHALATRGSFAMRWRCKTDDLIESTSQNRALPTHWNSLPFEASPGSRSTIAPSRHAPANARRDDRPRGLCRCRHGRGRARLHQGSTCCSR